MATHFAGIIIWQDGEDGEEYLVIEYDSGSGTQIKFPGGTNNDHPGEDMLTTLKRECAEETGLTPNISSLPAPVFSHEVGPHGDRHVKQFFKIHVGHCTGELRTMPKVDDGDKLSPPFWRTARELLVRVDSGGLFWSHREPLKEALKEI